MTTGAGRVMTSRVPQELINFAGFYPDWVVSRLPECAVKVISLAVARTSIAFASRDWTVVMYSVPTLSMSLPTLNCA